MKKRLLLLLSAILFLLSSCSPKEAKVSRTGFYFDTAVTVTLTCLPDEEDQIYSKLWEKCRYFENCFSTSLVDSDLYRLNHSGGKKVIVTKDTFNVLHYALDLARQHDGILDPSIGALKTVWNLSAPIEDYVIPSYAAIDEAKSHVNYQNILLDETDYSVTLLDTDMQIDLGYLAKGYIADELAIMLKEEGIPEAVLNLGGNILCYGRSEDNPYHFGIQEPFSDTGSLIYDTYMSDGTLVTSGIYERYREYGGIIYSHIINPFSGFPVDNSLYSVSVLSKKASSMKCDAYSTLLMLLDLDTGLTLVNDDPEIEAVFILPNNQIILSNGLQ